MAIIEPGGTCCMSVSSSFRSHSDKSGGAVSAQVTQAVVQVSTHKRQCWMTTACGSGDYLQCGVLSISCSLLLMPTFLCSLHFGQFCSTGQIQCYGAVSMTNPAASIYISMNFSVCPWPGSTLNHTKQEAKAHTHTLYTVQYESWILSEATV